MRINRDILYFITDTLRDVARGDYPRDWCPSVGLCTNLSDLIEDDDEYTYDGITGLIEAGCIAWPGGTGNPNFPVPASPDAHHGLGREVGADAAYFFSNDLYVGTYGKSRREFAAWLADWMEQQV